MSDNKILVGDMNRKQCLEILKRLLEAMETFDGISPSPERINALKMAIASLETDEAYQLEYESTTKNDLGVDAVSRKAVLEKAKSYNTDGWDMYTPLVVDVEDIEELPSVTPIRPKGHWIGHREHCENLGVMPSGLCAYEWCSNCDCGIDVREWHRNHYNYCPNCGADMRKVEE